LLIDNQVLSIDQVRSIQNKLYKNDKPLLDLIADLGYASKKDLLPLYAEAYDIEYIGRISDRYLQSIKIAGRKYMPQIQHGCSRH